MKLLGIILLDSVCTKENRLMHINLYNTVCVFSILIALASIGITILFWLRVPGLEDKIYIKLGLKEEVIIDYNIDVYKYDNDFRLTYDYSKNVLSVYRNEGDIERLYNFSIYELNVQEQNDIRNNYHGKIDINKQNVIALYGTFNTSNHDDSIATPYIELTSGIYGIMGNQIIMDDVFTKLFNRENIFKYKLFTAEGQIKNGADLKNGIIEEYFTDKNFKYIYNGKRLYEYKKHHVEIAMEKGCEEQDFTILGFGIVH